MSIEFRLSRDARLFEVRYIGELDFAMRARAVLETERRLKDCWVKALLVDFSQAWPAASDDDGEDADALAAFRHTLSRATFPRGMRVAFLNPPGRLDGPARSMQRTLHFTSRRFHDRNHALAWLRGRL
jgi:hypothetical protein